MSLTCFRVLSWNMILLFVSGMALGFFYLRDSRCCFGHPHLSHSERTPQRRNIYHCWSWKRGRKVIRRIIKDDSMSKTWLCSQTIFDANSFTSVPGWFHPECWLVGLFEQLWLARARQRFGNMSAVFREIQVTFIFKCRTISSDLNSHDISFP